MMVSSLFVIAHSVGGSYGISYDPARKLVYIAYGDHSVLLRYVLDDKDPEHPQITHRKELFTGSIRTVRVFENYVFVFGAIGVLVAPLTDHDTIPTFTTIRLTGFGYGENDTGRTKLIVDTHIV